MNLLLYILIFILIILVVFIISMSIYYKKVLKFYNTDTKQKIVEVTQKMFEIMGQDIPSKDRFSRLNEELIKQLDIQYSSICLYNGYNYELKSSNVESEYSEIICDIAKDNIFKTNIIKNNSKYITVTNKENLLYKSAIERNIKSAIFIPIYYNDKYIGFWLIESKKAKDFDDITDDYIENLKKNLAIFIEDTEFHNDLEMAKDMDEQTEFYNNIYLYSNTRKIISQYEYSSMMLIGLPGLPEVNEGYTRDIGNILLVRIANTTKDVLPDESICIRYSGNRFIVIIPNKTAQAVQPYAERLLSRYKDIYEYVNDKKVGIDTQVLIHTFKKQSNMNDEVQNLDNYMDDMKSRNVIKII